MWWLQKWPRTNSYILSDKPHVKDSVSLYTHIKPLQINGDGSDNLN